jgi:small subunit ribosomal protein S11
MNKSGGKKKEKKNIVNGRIYVQATFNNTIVTATDASGNVIAWSSSGSMGFKGVKKSTPYAAQMVAEVVVKKAKDMGLQRGEISIFLHILIALERPIP